MKYLIGIVCLFLMTPSALAREVPESWPEWLREAMVREANTKRTEEFSFADGMISGEVKGKFVEEPSLSDNYWFFTTNIKAESEFMCWVFPDAIDSAASTAAIVDNLINMNSEALGGVGVKSLYYTEVYSYEGSPVLALEWVYNTASEENKQIGFAKVRTALIGDSSLICGHTSVGYRETFADAFDHLVANINMQRSRDPYYETLHNMSINDTPVGFVRVSMIEDADGDTEIRTTEATMMPVDESNLSTTDGSSLEFSYSSGELINQYVTSVENGSVVVNAQLEFIEDNWAVTGTVQGKKLEAAIDSDVVIASSLGQQLKVREMMQSGQEEAVDFYMWIPDVDPTVLSTVEVALTGSAKGRLAFGPLVFDAELDKHGNLESGVTDLGGITMEITKVWEQGAPQ